MLYHYLYRSRASLPEDNAAEFDILRSSLRQNSENGVTGFLHREKDWYFHYFEGHQQDAGNLLERLLADDRHDDLTILSSGESVSRRFDAWSLGYSSSMRHSMQDFLGIDPACFDARSLSARDVLSFLKFTSVKQSLRLDPTPGWRETSARSTRGSFGHLQLVTP